MMPPPYLPSPTSPGPAYRLSPAPIADSDPSPTTLTVEKAEVREQLSQGLLIGRQTATGDVVAHYFLPDAETTRKRKARREGEDDVQEGEEHVYHQVREYSWQIEEKTKGAEVTPSSHHYRSPTPATPGLYSLPQQYGCCTCDAKDVCRGGTWSLPSPLGLQEQYAFMLRKDEGALYYNEVPSNIRLAKHRGQSKFNKIMKVHHRPFEEEELAVMRDRLQALEPEEPDESNLQGEEEDGEAGATTQGGDGQASPGDDWAIGEGDVAQED